MKNTNAHTAKATSRRKRSKAKAPSAPPSAQINSEASTGSPVAENAATSQDEGRSSRSQQHEVNTKIQEGLDGVASAADKILQHFGLKLHANADALEKICAMEISEVIAPLQRQLSVTIGYSLFSDALKRGREWALRANCGLGCFGDQPMPSDWLIVHRRLLEVADDLCHVMSRLESTKESPATA